MGPVLRRSPADSFWSTRDRRAHGRTVIVSRVQVDVSADACRSPRCITDVLVQLPDRPGWVLLRQPDTPVSLDEDAATGWQPGTPDSGYAQRCDRSWLTGRRRVEAMAARDVAYAVSPHGVGGSPPACWSCS